MKMLLFIVFYVVVDGVLGESVSVTEGDAVTLHTGLPEIQRDDVLEWRFGAEGALIAQINRGANKSNTYDGPYGRFRDRLKLDDQTGDLTIRNIRTEHSGLYEVTSNKHTQIFNVSGVSVPVDEVKSVSVLEGDPVTLNTDLTEIQQDDVIRWRFGPQHSLVAEINRKARKVSKHDGADGRFRDRLKLDYWTGSLTIRNITMNHSGLYEVDISTSSSGYTIHKTFSVTVSGEKRTMPVTEGEPVTLDTRLTEIQRDDFILWMFEDTVLAEIYKNQSSLVQQFYKYDGADERFRHILQLNNQTGSLTITQCKTSNSGLYELKINRHAVHLRFTVTVSGLSSGQITEIGVGILLGFAAVVAVLICLRHKISKLKCFLFFFKTDAVISRSVMEGEDIILTTDAELQRDDQILWTFGDENTPIAEFNGGTKVNSTPDGRFRERLKLDYHTGSPIITNITTKDSGLYELKISGSGKNSFRRFRVSVFESMPVMEGKSVTLRTDAKLQTDEEVQWMFGDKKTVIAETKGGTSKTTTYHGPEERFRDRLKLDHQTGSLTITNITLKQTGPYEVQINRSGKTSDKFFKVSLSDPTPLGSTEEGMHLLQPGHSLGQRSISNES